MSGKPGGKSSVGSSKGKPSGTKAKQPATSGKAVVPRGTRSVARHGGNQERGVIVPEGYTVRKIEPAKNYDVISFARAMNPDLGPRVKKLFDPEREAVLEAQETGIYVGWRCPEFKHDCQRVSSKSKCFCGHLLGEHANYTGRSVMVPCKQSGCKCKAFAWIPSRPEEIGEFWFQRRRDFVPEEWRAKCRCKHTHEDHDPTGLRRCKHRGCGCGAFDSPFLCAACDRHWEDHETFFETADERQKNGLPVGADYLPFSEIPSLRNMVLTGEDDGDMTYMKMMEANQLQALPPSGTNPSADNNTPFPFGGGKTSGFKPVYD